VRVSAFGVLMVFVLLLPLNLRECGSVQVPPEPTPGDAGPPSGPAEQEPSSPPSAFDPREFLCAFTGGPAGDSHDMMAGRRYTPDERARARQHIVAKLREFNGLAIREHSYRWTKRDREWMSPQYAAENDGGGINLLAELCATQETDEWILIGAHYDSVATTPGADDNASGVTATIMIARQLAALPTRNVNLMFAFFDQEEEGLIGSHGLARTFSSEGWNVRTAHIIDMIGWDSDDDRVVELAHCGMPVAPNDTLMQLYARAAEQLNARGDHRIGGVVRRDSCRSDHVYLTDYGIPSVQSCEEFSGDDVTPFYHRPGDTCDTLDYTFLRAVSALVAEAVTLQMQ